MGQVEVPRRALYGAQTQRAVENFPISGQGMPADFIRALALVKWAAAESNSQLGLLPKKFARPIAAEALRIWEGEHPDAFPVDVFQTGSGTSSNMNMNEVLATLASRRAGQKVSPNDHVNMGQSSNDVIPTTIHVAAAVALRGRLLPELKGLARALARKARSLRRKVKTGRTHLMDAMPVRMEQEIDAWRTPGRKEFGAPGSGHAAPESAGAGGAPQSAPESTPIRALRRCLRATLSKRGRHQVCSQSFSLRGAFPARTHRGRAVRPAQDHRGSAA